MQSTSWKCGNELNPFRPSSGSIGLCFLFCIYPYSVVVYYAIANLKLNNSRRKWKPNAKLVKPDYGVFIQEQKVKIENPVTLLI